MDDQKLWSELKSDKKTLPCPLYILGPAGQTQLALYPNLDGCEFGSNVCYLGKQIYLFEIQPTEANVTNIFYRNMYTYFSVATEKNPTVTKYSHF